MSGGDAKDGKLLCYNRGCGQYFDPSENGPESCVYHPGVPVFHDVYKKWACCEKKTTDFTEFLNIKGCTKSYHSNVKPPEPPKPVNKEDNTNKQMHTPCRQPLKPDSAAQRPDVNMPLKKLKSTVAPSLKSLLENLQKTIHSENDDESKSVAVGTQCKNGGCRAVYKGEQSNTETCVYHCGVPVFHEGMKYWTCCVKRTTDFDSFLEQVGCTTGNHLWHKPKNLNNMTNCRYDWHQTGNSVVISIYAKCAIPDSCHIEANPVKLNLHIVFGSEKNVFTTDLILYGVIDVDNSSVTYLGSKVEVTLRKSEPISWTHLTVSNKGLVKNSTTNTNSAQDVNVNSL